MSLALTSCWQSVPNPKSKQCQDMECLTPVSISASFCGHFLSPRIPFPLLWQKRWNSQFCLICAAVRIGWSKFQDWILPIGKKAFLCTLVQQSHLCKSLHILEDVVIGKYDVTDVLRRCEDQETCRDQKQHPRQLTLFAGFACWKHNAPKQSFHSRRIKTKSEIWIWMPALTLLLGFGLFPRFISFHGGYMYWLGFLALFVRFLEVLPSVADCPEKERMFSDLRFIKRYKNKSSWKRMQQMMQLFCAIVLTMWFFWERSQLDAKKLCDKMQNRSEKLTKNVPHNQNVHH